MALAPDWAPLKLWSKSLERDQEKMKTDEAIEKGRRLLSEFDELLIGLASARTIWRKRGKAASFHTVLWVTKHPT